MTRAETDGFLAPLTGLTVVVGEAQGKPSMPYVLVYPSLEFDVQERVTGSYGPRDVTHTLHSIGATHEQSRWMDEQVDKRLRPKGRGVTPVVLGRSCGAVRREFSRGPVSDDEIQENVFDAISEYVFRSRPK